MRGDAGSCCVAAGARRGGDRRPAARRSGLRNRSSDSGTGGSQDAWPRAQRSWPASGWVRPGPGRRLLPDPPARTENVAGELESINSDWGGAVIIGGPGVAGTAPITFPAPSEAPGPHTMTPWGRAATRERPVCRASGQHCPKAHRKAEPLRAIRYGTLQPAQFLPARCAEGDADRCSSPLRHIHRRTN